jgi:SAM-dependent methyltransferase
MINTNDMGKAYDEMSDDYECFFCNWEEHKNKQSESYDNIIKSLNFNKSAKILDITCGIGTQIIGLYERGYKNIYGSDISKKQINRANELCTKHDCDIKTFVCDACEIDNITAKESKDIILSSSNSIPLLGGKDNIKTMLEKSFHALKKDGVFIANIRDYTNLVKTRPLIAEMGNFIKNNIEHIWYETADWKDEKTYLSDIYFSKINNNKITGKRYKFPEVYAVCKSDFIDLLNLVGFSDVKFYSDGYHNISRPIYIAKK